MTLSCSRLILCQAVLGLLTAASAEEKPAASLLKPFPGLVISGAIRTRLEVPVGSAFVPTSVDSYLQSRLRLNVAYRPTPWLSFVGETQDAHVFGYNAAAPSSMQDPFDLRQAYVQVGTPEGPRPILRLGRQELTLGAGRLIATGEWSNITKTFDIARLGVKTRVGTLDFIGGSVVQPDPSRFDRHKPGEHFYASYNSFTGLVPKAVIEPYVIAKTVVGAKGELGPAGDAAVLTPGLRMTFQLPLRFDYSVEAVKQFGTWGSDPIRAWAYTTTLGWTVVKTGWKPRVSADYSWASGDQGSKDGVRGTFDALYGAAQPFFSETGQFGWKNIRNVRAGIDFTVLKRVKVVLDYRDYSLATVRDGLYNSGGTRTVLNTKATSSHVGQGVETQVVYTLPQKMTVAFGVGELIAGDYLKQSGKGGGYLHPFLYWGRKF